MPVSVLSKKGQTTIPKEIRKFLKLESKDKILYQIEGKRVIIKLNKKRATPSAGFPLHSYQQRVIGTNTQPATRIIEVSNS